MSRIVSAFVESPSGTGKVYYYALEILAALFLEVLHSAIRKALKERTDDIVEGEALQLGSGWLHIHGKSILNVTYALVMRTKSWS